MAPGFASAVQSLLSTRHFVRDMALLAEGCIMADMHTAETAAAASATRVAGVSFGSPCAGGFWDFDADAVHGSEEEAAHRVTMESRERHPFWAPDKVGEIKMSSNAEACEVRCWVLKRRYEPIPKAQHLNREPPTQSLPPIPSRVPLFRCVATGPSPASRLGAAAQAALRPRSHRVVRHRRRHGEGRLRHRLLPSCGPIYSWAGHSYAILR